MEAGGILGTLRILVDADTAKAQRALKSFGGRAQLAGAAAGAALGGAAIAGLKLGDQYDAAMDTMRAATGATGDEYAKLEAVSNSVAGRVTANLDEVTAATTALYQHTRSVSDATVESLVDLSKLTDTGGAGIEAITTLYAAWGVEADKQVAVNDMLLRAYQASGVGVDALSDSLSKNAAVLKEAGLGLTESTVLLAGLEQAGVDANAIMGPLRKSIGNLVKAGEDPKQAVQGLFEAIKNAPDDVAAGKLAMESFGAKGVTMAGLIRDGTLDVEKLWATVADGSETVQAASDDTRDWADGFKELSNKALSAIGPITSAFAGLADAMGNAIYLLPAIGGVVGRGIGKLLSGDRAKAAAKLAGARIGKVYQLAIAGAKVVWSALASVWSGILASPVGKAAAVAGAAIGGVFSTAMSTAIAAGTAIKTALVGVLSGSGLMSAATAGGLVVGAAFVAAAAGVILAWNLKEDIEKKTREGAAALTDQTKAFLEAAPTQEEIDKALYGIAHTGDKLGLIERAYYEANVQGVKTISDQQYTAIRLYGEAIAKGLSHAEALAAAGFGNVAAATTQGTSKVTTAVTTATPPIVTKVASVGKQLRDALASSAPKIATAWDAITNALSKGPDIKSFKARMQESKRAVAYNAKQLARAVRVGDVATAGIYAQRLIDAKRARRQLRGNATGVLKDAAAILGRHRGMARRQQKGMTKDVEREARRAARIAERQARRQAKAVPDALKDKEPAVTTAAGDTAQAVETPLTQAATDATTWGSHLGANFAAGIASQYGAAALAAAQLAEAVHSRIGFSAPPKHGPLSGIHQWGPHMVVQWLTPIRRHEKHAKKAGERLGKALQDGIGTTKGGTGRRGPSWAGQGARVGRMRVDRLIVERGGGGGTVHIHVGTLIANDAGIDQLARRIERRTRVKSRTPTRYNDAG